MKGERKKIKRKATKNGMRIVFVVNNTGFYDTHVYD
jgi:hypothetical protein